MPDSCYYLRVAGNVSSGKIYVEHRAGIDRYMTAPLYPLLTNVASRLTRDFEKAGMTISIAAALLLVFVLFGWGNRAWGIWAGGIAAWLVASSQAKLAAYILTESLFTLMYILSAWLIWEVVRKATLGAIVRAGIAVGLATLSKEIGFVGVPIGVMAILLVAREGEAPLSPREKIVRSGVFAATSCIVVAPYWLYSLLVKGTLWGSRFVERMEGSEAASQSAVDFVSAFAIAGKALWAMFPAPVMVVALAGLFLPSSLLTRREDKSRIFVAGWIAVHVLALGILGVNRTSLWTRYLYPVDPLLLLLAGRGTVALAELSGKAVARLKPSGKQIAVYATTLLVAAGLILSVVNLLSQKKRKYLQPSFQARLYQKGTPEVARDFLSNYTLIPDTYVYDRKPFIAYYLNATWGGLPPRMTLADLEREAKNHPVLLVVNSSVISSYGYPQLKPLLAAKSIPQGWNLLGMYFFAAYGASGRLIALYSYGDAYRPTPPIKPEDFSYDGHLRGATEWLGRGRIDRVQSHAKAAVQLDPLRPEAYTLLSKMLVIQGIGSGRIDVFEDAIDLARKAMQFDPQNKDIRNLLCMASEAKSDIDGSKPLCK